MKFCNLVKPSLLSGGMIALATMFLGCSKSSQMVETGSFPAPITLTGHSISFDTIPGGIGTIKVYGNDYYFYIYTPDAENFLMKTDTDFHPMLFFAKRGEGPGEVKSVGSYGSMLANRKFGLMDEVTGKLFSADIEQEGQVSVERDFLDENGKFSAWQIVETDPGRYVGVPKGFEYGLTEYDTSTKTLRKWPICFDFGDSTKINQAFQSGRSLAFNAKNEVVAETYKALPLVILHNLDGSLNKVISFDKVPDISTVTDSPDNFIPKLVLTDNYIYAYTKKLFDKEGDLYVFDYDGNPKAHLVMRGQSFDIDVPNRRIVTVNPNAEDESEYVMWYSIPDIIEEP